MGGECGTDGRQERCIEGFCEQNPRKRGHLVDLAVDGRIILILIFNEVGWGHELDWSGSV